MHPIASIMIPTDRFARIRAEEFGGLQGAYLDAASMAPLPARTRRVAEHFNHLRTHPHELTGDHFARFLDDARQGCARLIGADPSEIALGSNTSFGINVAALGLDVPAGSTVLVPDREFPANVYPWMLSERVRLELVPGTPEGNPDEERILERLRDPDVSVLAISSVQFTNGYVADLDRLGDACRDAGVFFVVDAIQSLGQLPLDVRRSRIDVLASGGHKWLCGPFGAGFLYVSREVQDRVLPRQVGWQAMEASGELGSLLDYAPGFVDDARRYEQGTTAFQDVAALAASVGLIEEAGVAQIRDYLRALLEPLRRWAGDKPGLEILSQGDASKLSGIFTFRTPNIEGVHQRLKDAGVICSLREGAIRIAPHFYNRPEEISLLIEAAEDAAARGWA